MRQLIKNILTTSFFLSSIVGYSQEYDDLYFNKSDREKQRAAKIQETSKLHEDDPNTYNSALMAINRDSEPVSFLGKQYYTNPRPEDFSENVKLKSAAHYQPKKTIESYTNSNFAPPPSASTSTVLPTDLQNDDADRPIDPYQNDPVVINNYYGGNGWNNLNGPRWNVGLGWNNWGGNFWDLSFGWGGWYDPWFYDPFWNFSWGWNFGFGWNRRNAWNGQRWIGRGRPVRVANDRRARRNTVRGARSTRGGAISSSGRAANVRNSSVASARSESARYSRHQSRYFDWSRNSQSSATNARSTDNADPSPRRSVSNAANASVRQSANPSRSSSNRTYRNNNHSKSQGTARPRTSRSAARRGGSVRSGSSHNSSGRSSSVRSSAPSGRSSARSSGRSGARSRN